MNNKPIGIFDSGVGGLTVWSEVRKLLPNEDLVYFADSLNCPYGSKPAEQIIELVSKITIFLIENNCKLIIVACNTATAAAIDYLRANFNIPFVGMEPAVKPAAMNTQSGKIGILATKGTFEGRLYQETSRKYTGHIDTKVQIGEGLVELVETNKYETNEARLLLKKYIDPMISEGVDQVVLGCTHYPFYKTMIESMVGPGVKVIDPAPAIARRTHDLLRNYNLLNAAGHTGTNSFYTSGEPEVIEVLLQGITRQTFKASVVQL